MSNELAMRTFAYLISNYKENNETIINSEEIEAIEFLIKENQELKKDIKNIIRILNKNCDDLEATEEEFESLEKWNK